MEGAWLLLWDNNCIWVCEVSSQTLLKSDWREYVDHAQDACIEYMACSSIMDAVAAT